MHDKRQETSTSLIPARRVWEHFNVTDRTLARWLDRPGMNFPRPAAVINGRRYWNESEIKAWRPPHQSEAA